MKTLKVMTLLGQLILALHGDFHPPHSEHNGNMKVVAPVAR